jgi:hypothetical protein
MLVPSCHSQNGLTYTALLRPSTDLRHAASVHFANRRPGRPPSLFAYPTITVSGGLPVTATACDIPGTRGPEELAINAGTNNTTLTQPTNRIRLTASA